MCWACAIPVVLQIHAREETRDHSAARPSPDANSGHPLRPHARPVRACTRMAYSAQSLNQFNSPSHGAAACIRDCAERIVEHRPLTCGLVCHFAPCVQPTRVSYGRGGLLVVVEAIQNHVFSLTSIRSEVSTATVCSTACPISGAVVPIIAPEPHKSTMRLHKTKEWPRLLCLHQTAPSDSISFFSQVNRADHEFQVSPLRRRDQAGLAAPRSIRLAQHRPQPRPRAAEASQLHTFA